MDDKYIEQSMFLCKLDEVTRKLIARIEEQTSLKHAYKGTELHHMKTEAGKVKRLAKIDAHLKEYGQMYESSMFPDQAPRLIGRNVWENKAYITACINIKHEMRETGIKHNVTKLTYRYYNRIYKEIKDEVGFL